MRGVNDPLEKIVPIIIIIIIVHFLSCVTTGYKRHTGPYHARCAERAESL